jgi:hypothetical protein
MRFQPHNPRPKHKVYDVGGECAYEEMCERLADILGDDDDPSTVLVMGHTDDLPSEDSYFTVLKWLKGHTDLDADHLGRLLFYTKDGDKAVGSLAGEVQAEMLAKLMREPNGVYNAEGKDHATVMECSTRNRRNSCPTPTVKILSI